MTETETQPRRSTTFGHLEIEYDERVLAPRAWTEAQSAWAAELLTDLPAGDVLELCAGAGHIGLLAVAGTSRHLVQVDADEVACAFAEANAARAAIRHASHAGVPAEWTVEVRQGWLEDALEPRERFALVIADPPWVRSGDADLHPDDPRTAIDGGDDGLDPARSCLDVAGRHLLAGGAVILQLGDPGQVEAVRRHLEERMDLGLRVLEHRSYEAGVVVHLARVPSGATG